MDAAIASSRSREKWPPVLFRARFHCTNFCTAIAIAATMQGAGRRVSAPLRALHGALLQRLRVQSHGSAGWDTLRALSAKAHVQGTYLDRSQVVDRVLSVLRSNAKVDPAKVSETASFQRDLLLDSLDEVEVLMAVEEEFALEIPDAEADKIKSTKDVIEFVASHPRAK